MAGLVRSVLARAEGLRYWRDRGLLLLGQWMTETTDLKGEGYELRLRIWSSWLVT